MSTDVARLGGCRWSGSCVGRALRGFVVALVSVLLTGACGSDGALKDEDEFWRTFQSDADWAYGFPTLSAMRDAADIVATGRITGLRPAQEIRGDAAEDVSHEIIMVVSADEWIRGSNATGAFELSLFLPVPSDSSYEAELKRLERSLPGEPALFMLRLRRDRPYHVVMNGYAIWTRTSRAELDAPLNSSPPSDEDIYASELRGVTSVAMLADKLRR
jgi:hypothetical protein